MHNNIHLDFILDILVRSSVKSLLRFKCVSKQWCSLISDPIFVKRHVDLAMIDKDVECARRKLLMLAEIFFEIDRENRILISSLFHGVECEAMTSNHITATEFENQLIASSPNRMKFIGSFNGLVCLCLGKDTVFLFNPATEEMKRIPDLFNNKRPRDASIARHVYQPAIYGFNYDHSLDDYNVVKILFNLVVCVYSLKTDTWRRVENFPYHGCFWDPREREYISDPGVPLNGAVHWVFDRDGWLERKPNVIVAFDFAEGKFRELPKPSDAEDNAIGVGVLGECLCWLTRDIDVATEQHYFWVMKEYGVKESWTKVFLIDILFMKLRPLSYLKNEEALLEIDGRLVLYSPREHTHREVSIRGIHGRIFEAVVYIESFVSPNAWKRESEKISN